MPIASPQRPALPRKGPAVTDSFRLPLGLAEAEFRLAELHLKRVRIGNHIDTLSNVFEGGADLPPVEDMPSALHRVRSLKGYQRWLPKAQEALHWTNIEILQLDQWMKCRWLARAAADLSGSRVTDAVDLGERTLALLEGLEFRGVEFRDAERAEVGHIRLFVHEAQ